MATRLHTPVERKLVDGRVVRIEYAGVSIRAPHSRTWIGPVSWNAIESLGAKQMAAAALNEKEAKRGTRKINARLSRRGL